MKNTVIQPLQSRLKGWLLLRALLGLAGAVGLALLFCVLADASMDLSEATRVAAPSIVGLLLVGVLILGIAGLWRINAYQVARWFERKNPSVGSRLTNAVQLDQRDGVSPVEEFLRREAVALGRQAAADLAAWPVVRGRVRAALAVAGVALAGWLILGVTGGDVLRAVAPRYLDPHGDHPPYSKLKIEVTPGRSEVLFGGQLEIHAKAAGLPVDKLWLVARSGTNVTKATMFLAPDKSYFQTLANLREVTEYYVTDGRARSHRFSVGIRLTPQITLVEVTTTPPAYAGRPAHTARISDEAQSALGGTEVKFRVASNRPLKTGTLTLTPVLGGKPLVVNLQPEAHDTIVSGGFTLKQAIAFTVSVRDINGLESLEPKRGRFNLLIDERPRIFVLEPGRDAVATPNFTVPVRVQAEDDYGVVRVGWLRGHNRSVEQSLEMKLTPKKGVPTVESTGAFELSKLGVRPGDVIEYYFEAADNYPDGPNVALSRIYRLEIITEDQYQRILRQAAARKALFEPYFRTDAWLRRMAERARKLAKQPDNPSAEEKEAIRQEAAALSQEMDRYRDELSKLFKPAMMFDVEQSFRDSLVTQKSKLDELRRKWQEALGNGLFDPKQFRKLADELSELTKQEDKNVDEPAQQIASVAQLLAQADQFVKLAKTQATIAQLLRRFAEHSGQLSRSEQVEVQELLHQQQRVQEELRKMVTRLPELLAQVPPDSSFDPLREDVNKFLEAVSSAKIEEVVNDAVRLLTESDTAGGQLVAQKAAEAMDKLISKCNGLESKGERCLRFQPKLQQALGNTLQQILGAMGVGNGDGGRDGYSLYNDDMALYGPNMELAGDQAGGSQESRSAAVQRATRVAGDSRDPALGRPSLPGRVKLQPDAKFPLRYRDLVGEYFRIIAESGAAEGDKK